jgi:hypothetical protein
MSSRDELTLDGYDAVGESNEDIGKGDNCKGLKGTAEGIIGECAHAYGEVTSVGGVGNPDDEDDVALALELKALAIAAMATAATTFPDPGGTGINGGGTGK